MILIRNLLVIYQLRFNSFEAMKGPKQLFYGNISIWTIFATITERSFGLFQDIKNLNNLP